MVGIERALDRVAFETGLDPLDVRKRNFYPAMGSGGGDVPAKTPYHMFVEDCVVAEIVEETRSLVGLSRPARGDRGLQRRQPDPQEGPRPDPR